MRCSPTLRCNILQSLHFALLARVGKGKLRNYNLAAKLMVKRKQAEYINIAMVSDLAPLVFNRVQFSALYEL